MDTVNSDNTKARQTRILLEREYQLILDEKQYTGVTGNISLGGLYLKTVEPKLLATDIGRSCGVVLQLGALPIIYNCRIVYINDDPERFPAGAGVAFEDGQDEQIDRLKQFLLGSLEA